MPPVNPNALSDAEYWAMANRATVQPATTVPQTIADISRGAANWGNMQIPQGGWIADIANRGGMAVQQNGYDATAAMPVAAGPAWAWPSPIPAYSQSGAHMTMPGSREAWQNWGIPPIMMQRDPYATAAYRAYTDPYGQIGVQPLIGFPSAYPHVLSGVPNSPFRELGFINALLPQAGFMPFMGMPQMPMSAQPRVQGGGGGGGGGTTPAKRNTAQRVPSSRLPFLYGDTDTMPLPTSYQRPTPQAAQAAQASQVNRPLDGTYLPPVVAQPERQFDGTYLPPVVAQPERQFDGTYLPPAAPQAAPAAPQVPQQIPRVQAGPSFTPNLLSVEEAEELADGMYVDPNKTLMQNLFDGLGAVSVPLSLGAGPLLYSAPRIVGGAVVPEAAGTLPSAVRALP